ncbi:MAG: hypothetical protein H6635_03130 [Anaerolineales bacterium]|nr:hypothetical protein [Anaerolineales bacterium]MCB9144336.1 hypothetical protein [Anaerolineales bacterium]
MKTGTCPKCGSNEILTNLALKGSDSVQPYVSVTEPEPPNRPFIWVPKFVQSAFHACICGTCGYTEFYAIKHQELNEARKNGFIGK